MKLSIFIDNLLAIFKKKKWTELTQIQRNNITRAQAPKLQPDLRLAHLGSTVCIPTMPRWGS